MTTLQVLAGKVAFVTGGGRGIGRAIAERFAEAGAHVAIASRKRDVLDRTAAQLAHHSGRVLPVACHVGKVEDLERAIRETEATLGPIDILVNNSATNIQNGPALEATDEQFAKMLEINTLAALRLVRLVVPGMIVRGSGGSIINVASISGLSPQPGGILYSMTKAALIMLTRAWAREFGAHRIRVNALAPGLIQTDFSEIFWKNPDSASSFIGTQVLPHLGQPSEVGAAALFLASDAASFVTGHVLVVDGGALA
jgi:NAD(P)-dependent dehydrogenase (short-subunit alcohol dehydrogenase family)